MVLTAGSALTLTGKNATRLDLPRLVCMHAMAACGQTTAAAQRSSEKQLMLMATPASILSQLLQPLRLRWLGFGSPRCWPNRESAITSNDDTAIALIQSRTHQKMLS